MKYRHTLTFATPEQAAYAFPHISVYAPLSKQLIDNVTILFETAHRLDEEQSAPFLRAMASQCHELNIIIKSTMEELCEQHKIDNVGLLDVQAGVPLGTAGAMVQGCTVPRRHAEKVIHALGVRQGCDYSLHNVEVSVEES